MRCMILGPFYRALRYSLVTDVLRICSSLAPRSRKKCPATHATNIPFRTLSVPPPFDDLSVAHVDLTAAMLCKFAIVCDDDNRAAGRVQVFEKLENLDAGFTIQISRRFIGENH